MSASVPSSQRIVGWVVRHFDTKDGKAWRLFVFKSIAGSSPHKPRTISIAYSHGDSRSEKVVGSFSVADLSMELDDASLRLLSGGGSGEELPLTRPSVLASVAGGGWLSLSWTEETRHDLAGTTLMGRAEHLVYIAQVRKRPGGNGGTLSCPPVSFHSGSGRRAPVSRSRQLLPQLRPRSCRVACLLLR